MDKSISWSPQLIKNLGDHSPDVPPISKPCCLCFHHGLNLRVSPSFRLRVKTSLFPPVLGYETRLSMHVTTCSVTFQLRSQTVPDSEQPSEKRGLNCGELRDRYTDPPRGTTKELGYPCPEGHGKMWGSRPSHMLENTLFRGVFSNRWHLESSGSDIVTKTETLPEDIRSVHGAKKRDPITLAKNN